MSRSGYSDCWDIDERSERLMNLYRGTVERSIRGKRGQRLLRDLKEALEAMPEKKLAAGGFEDDNGCVCALGAVGRARGVLDELKGLVKPVEDEDLNDDSEDVSHEAAAVLDVARPLAAEVMFMNDEMAGSPEERWRWMHRWVCQNLRPQGGRG